jgi:hypothetical protein
MRECRTYGSVRGALGNGRPYRDYLVEGWGLARRVPVTAKPLSLASVRA